MSNIVTLSFEKHADLKVIGDKRHCDVSATHLMPLVPGEIGRAGTCFPVIIAKNTETDQFLFAAMFGFQPGENLFLEDNQWVADYEPLQIRRQPFFISENGDEKVICFDSDSPAVSSNDEGEAVFDEESKPSKYLETVQQILQELVRGELQSKELLRQLSELELIMPFSFNIDLGDGKKQTVQGAYMIDEKKLKELDDEKVLGLYRSGALTIIHNLQNSLNQIANLLKRKKNLGQK